MTRHSAGTLDDDNLRSALKATRDGIADRLGVPDNSPAVEWKYEQANCKRGTYGVSVQIEERYNPFAHLQQLGMIDYPEEE